MSIKRYASQAGDTIVEVMFAVAVVGMVIGGSYVIATRALRTGRYAQEQTEALKQAESQIERLKYLASKGLPVTDSQSIFNTGASDTSFCINDSFVKILSNAGATYTAGCRAKGGDKLYDILVNYSPGSVATGQDLFNIVVTWDRQGTETKGTMRLAYRLHNAPPPS